LNHFDTLERFDDICDANGGHPWVTVFTEHKNSNETFEEIDNDTIIVFCKFFGLSRDNPCDGDPSYLGCLHVKNTMHCQDLFSSIARDLRKLPEGTFYDAYVEKEDHCVDLTSCVETIDKCGIASGSVVILTEKGFNMKDLCTVRTFQLAIQPSESEVEGDDAQNPAAPANTSDGSKPIGAAPDGAQSRGNQLTAQAGEAPAIAAVTEQLSAFAFGPKSGPEGDIPVSERCASIKLPIRGTTSFISETIGSFTWSTTTNPQRNTGASEKHPA